MARRWRAGQRGSRVATHSTWWVIGKRSKARRSAQPVARARRTSAGPGPARPGRRRRRRSAGPRTRASIRTTDAPGPGPRRVEHDEVGPAQPEPAQHVVDPAALDADPVAGRRRLWRASATAPRSPSTAVTRPRGPDAVGERAANSPTPQYRSSAGSPGLRLERVEHGGHERLRGARVDLPEAAAGDPERRDPRPTSVRNPGPRPSGRTSRSPVDGGHRDLDRAHAGPAALRDAGSSRDERVRDRARRRPARPRGSGARCSPAVPSAATAQLHPGAPAEPVLRPPATASTSTSTVEPGQPVQLLARPPRPSASRCAGGVACCQSQPPQRPGPADGQGGATRSGDAARGPRRRRPAGSATSRRPR